MKREKQSPFVESLAQFVRQRADQIGLKQTALARALGASTSTVGIYWHGERPWPTEMLPLLASALRTTLVGMITGTVVDVPALPPTEEGVDTVEVEEIDLSYGLGGSFSDDNVDRQTHRFPQAWIESITRAPPTMLFFAKGRGDSMMPTIADGDMLLIDRSQITIREQDAVWAITSGDIAMIKRVRILPDRVDLMSDNDRISDYSAAHDEIHVVGRVVFIGRRM